MNGRQATFLDVTRTVAAQSVLVGHVYNTVIGEFPVRLGNFGVLLFFVLSGYLICYTVLEKSNRKAGYGLRLYFYDRFFRIFVAFVPALFLVLLLDGIRIHKGVSTEYAEYFTARDFIGTLLMLAQNPVGLFADELLHLPQLKIATFGSARPFWTVAIEWWLYLFFGWAALRDDRLSRAPIKFLAVWLLLGIVPLFNAVAGTGEGLTLVWFAAAGIAWVFYYRRMEVGDGLRKVFGTRALGLYLAAALIVVFGLLITRMFWVSYVLPGFQWKPFEFYDLTFGILLLGGFFVTMLWLDQAPDGGRSRVAQFFSDYSYSLYLIHYSLIIFLWAFGLRAGPTLSTAIFYFVACNLAAIAFWWLFERHYPALKRAWLAYRS